MEHIPKEVTIGKDALKDRYLQIGGNDNKKPETYFSIYDEVSLLMDPNYHMYTEDVTGHGIVIEFVLYTPNGKVKKKSTANNCYLKELTHMAQKKWEDRTRQQTN